MKEKDLKKRLVKEKYGEVALGKWRESSCCCCSSEIHRDDTITSFSQCYEGLPGYFDKADLHIGCGIPTEFIGIKKGDVVLDLGSGAGNDCFLAHHLTGDAGKVIGLDFTDEMVDKAQENKQQKGYQNIEFIKGDIENIPINDQEIDIVISNCVLNLVPDKEKAFKEIYRVLKYGGVFSISDMVIKGELPDSIRDDAELYVGCVAGAIQLESYIDIIEKSGFDQPEIKNIKRVMVPVEILVHYMTEDEINEFRTGNTGIFSVTITASKTKKDGA
ncbi:MAG: arsenite methyltransferase [Bacteroidetes bacterium]|jgi:arsenite methyltransferase|nr:arsenite methyltransferase [Bacteroidota bacterium]MBT5529254.1 arsenite methyltransferase [Cytophagia bacterium]MBT3935137.1 arsenite methyltransferase [Bacteroidota bacterium]MBT4338791.1 arsenite methyltransferase [Bacteroidota bacterium]MBT4727005.1 arsenite methyltransferase [Bacteroidota bacterium]